MNIWLLIWSVVLVIAVIAESLTLQLVTIWFAAGALIALLMAWLGCSVLGQMIIFTAVSALLLCVTRPLLKKLQVRDVLPTNTEAEIGRLAVVTEQISNADDTGRVRIGGVNWKARTSQDGMICQSGETVRVERIAGTTAYVIRTEN
ncbi:MAG: NfeD family protein [Oscillospiraceae bacterium]|nr:NfeD family protein [Oscillospiraceae bacterium]